MENSRWICKGFGPGNSSSKGWWTLSVALYLWKLESWWHSRNNTWSPLCNHTEWGKWVQAILWEIRSRKHKRAAGSSEICYRNDIQFGGGGYEIYRYYVMLSACAPLFTCTPKVRWKWPTKDQSDKAWSSGEIFTWPYKVLARKQTTTGYENNQGLTSAYNQRSKATKKTKLHQTLSRQNIFDLIRKKTAGQQVQETEDCKTYRHAWDAIPRENEK